MVRSLAGHDKGWLYLVLRVEAGFVWVADGKHHTLAQPKKKSLKHLAPMGAEAELSAVGCDAHIRKAIKRLKAQ